jgi:exopolysaccharide biosynthesis polyprenyl glycosylphosphotransferase
MANSKAIVNWRTLRFHANERRAILIFGDFLMAIAALAIALYWWDRSMRFIEMSFEFMQRRGYLWFFLLPLVWLIFMVDLYDLQKSINIRKVLRGIATAAISALGIYAIIYITYSGSPDTLLPRLGVAIFLVAVSILTLFWRLIYVWVFTSSRFLRKVLVVGAGRSGQVFIQTIIDSKPNPFLISGVIDDDPNKQNNKISGVEVLGTSKDFYHIIQEQQVSEIIVAVTGSMNSDLFQALLDAQEQGLQITRMPVAYEELTGRVPIQLLEADWILRSFVDQARISSFFEFSKRLIDIVGGLVGTLLFGLFFPFIGFLVLLDDGLPIIYTQTRSGKGGRPYKILKFRTMRNDAEADGRPKWAKEDDERATRSGKFMRKAHIDELPQFLNVLRGDMSLVGPRAERPELVEFFQTQVPFYRARLLVKPGITGWAQINFGYASTIEETTMKLEYDLYYILHRSLPMDFTILLRTPAMMLGLRGR